MSGSNSLMLDEWERRVLRRFPLVTGLPTADMPARPDEIADGVGGAVYDRWSGGHVVHDVPVRVVVEVAAGPAVRLRMDRLVANPADGGASSVWRAVISWDMDRDDAERLSQALADADRAAGVYARRPSVHHAAQKNGGVL